jgi:hypothetical protein
VSGDKACRRHRHLWSSPLGSVGAESIAAPIHHNRNEVLMKPAYGLGSWTAAFDDYTFAGYNCVW